MLLRRPVSELAAGLQEAVAARILVGSGSELAFRHQLIRQALYASMPTALRTALHAEAARELAATDADALSVAQQLFAARQPGEGWARAWLIQTAPTLTTQAPLLAADLLRRELDETPSGRRGPGRAHGQPGAGPAGGRLLRRGGPAGPGGAAGDD